MFSGLESNGTICVTFSLACGENKGLQRSAVCVVLTIFRIAYDSLAQATVTRVEGPPVFLAVHISVHRELILKPGGGGTVIYGLYGYVPLWRVWFSSVLLKDRVYKSERSGLQ